MGFLTLYCCTKCVNQTPMCELHKCASSSFLCCGMRREFFTRKLSNMYVGVKLLCSYLFTTFCAWKYSSYMNMHVLLYRLKLGGYPKQEMLTQMLLCLFSACHQTLSPYQVSCVGVLWLVIFASSTGSWRYFYTIPVVKMNPFLTKCCFWPHGVKISKWMCIKCWTTSAILM